MTTTWPTLTQALASIEARKSGVFDDPDLIKFGPLSIETDDILLIKRQALEAYDFTVGPLDPRVSTDFAAAFMVVECLEDRELPFTNPQDGSGDWALVGDDLTDLINRSFDALCEMCGH